jgi:hypothetical protein
MLEHLPKPSYHADHAERIFKTSVIPTSASNKDLVLNVLDQAGLGSCVLNATGQAVRCCQVRAKVVTPLLPDRDNQYAWCRIDDGSPIDQDTCTFAATAADVLRRRGFVGEIDGTYSDDPTVWAKQPSAQYEHDAFDQRDTTETSLHPIVGTDDEKWAQVLQLSANRVPIAICGDVSVAYAQNNFDPTKPLDAPAAADVDGGHCQTLVGFTDQQTAEILNSWSTQWGNGGYALYTRAYVLASSELYAIEHAVVKGVVL